MIKSLRNFIVFIIVFAGIDQISKHAIIYIYNVDSSQLNAQFMSKINSFLNFHLVWNKGFAFGFFQNDVSMINNFYMLFMIILIFILFIYAVIINKKSYYFCFSLIIGGAFGNLIDRYLYQAVLDFIDLHYMNYHWYVFNIADITISLGCILIILLELFFEKKQNENN